MGRKIQPRKLNYQPQNLEQWADATMDFPWYAANFISIEDKETHTIIPFVLNEAQVRVWNEIKSIFDIRWWLSPETRAQELILKTLVDILKSRQEGISTLSCAIMIWLINNFSNMRCLLSAHKIEASDHLYAIVTRMYTHMPETYALGDGTKVRVKATEVKGNVKELTVDLGNDARETSSIYVVTAGSKQKAARSFSYNFVHLSEVGDEVYDDGQLIGAMMPALSRDALVIAEGTANGMGGWFFNTYQKGRAGLSNWCSICINWHQVRKNRMGLLRGEVIKPKNEWERNAVERYKLDQEQLKWARYIQENECPDEGKLTRLQWFEQEYCSNDHDCFVSSGSNYFDGEAMNVGIDYCKNHDYPITRYSVDDGMRVDELSGRWRFLNLPGINEVNDIDPKDKFIITADVAEGLAHGDYSTAGVWLKNAWGPDWLVGYYRGKPDIDDFADILCTVGKHFNTALMVPEANPVGTSLGGALKRNRYPRMYIQEPGAEGLYVGTPKKRYGFLTTPKTKWNALAELHKGLKVWSEDHFHPEGIVIPFLEVWLEMQGFVVVDGKARGRDNTHDDLVAMCWIAGHVLGRTHARITPRQMPKELPERKMRVTIGKLIGKAASKQLRKLSRVTNG